MDPWLDEICGVPFDPPPTVDGPPQDTRAYIRSLGIASHRRVCAVLLVGAYPLCADRSAVCHAPLSCRAHTPAQKKSVRGRTMSFAYLLNRQNSMIASAQSQASAAAIAAPAPHAATVAQLHS